MSANPQLSAAYSICRHITRSKAKNFYYAFLVLPRRKRNALCAVYAFMRQADDLSDDPAIPARERREKLTQWMEAFHKALEGRPTDDPVLFALADTQRNYNVPVDWLDKLVYGTLMDVPDAVNPMIIVNGPGAGDPVVKTPGLTFRSFEDLYEYCYHVASVVGLICIRIFGYRDPKAEKLAERTGVAFQLTNILRDVKEDAEMGRVYLPERDLETFGLTASAVTGGVSIDQLRPVLQLEAERALGYYRAGEELIPLIDDDSQPALWSLMEVYRQLLQKIIARNYDVFSGRVSLSTAEKLKVLGRGFIRRLT